MHEDAMRTLIGSKMCKRSMVLPSSMCIICISFGVLLACDMINIEVNTHILGSQPRTVEQDSTPPSCEETITHNSLCNHPNTSSMQPPFFQNAPSPSGDALQTYDSKTAESEASDDAYSPVATGEHISGAETSPAGISGLVAILKQVKAREGESREEAVNEARSKITVDQIRAAGMSEDMVQSYQMKHGHNSAPVKQKYTFKMHEPNSLGFGDMKWCPGLRKVDLKPVDEKFKFLFVLGAQKGGTTWLHRALLSHPAFVGANDAYLGGWQKEVRFFNTMPTGSTQQYLDQFPSGKRLRALYDIPTVFLDSTPYYLFSPSVAPKIKQAIPHAKFVIVLRDPVARSVSAHNMHYNNKRAVPSTQNSNNMVRCSNRMCTRPVEPLLQEFRKHRDLGFRWPEDLSGCNFNTTVEPHERKTWADCWRCDHFVFSCPQISEEEAKALGGCEQNTIPHTSTIPLTQFGLYAAQIAWWLSFFPPETFLILTREELQDSERAVKALNKILVHVGYPDARPFTEKMIGKTHGLIGKYTGDMSEDDQQALREIKEFFEQPNKDLQTLMDTYFPDTHFTGFTPEYTDEGSSPNSSPKPDSQTLQHKQRFQSISRPRPKGESSAMSQNDSPPSLTQKQPVASPNGDQSSSQDDAQKAASMADTF